VSEKGYPRPCPTCGSQDISIITQSSLTRVWDFETYAVCFQCAAAGPVSYADWEDDDDEVQAHAVAGWNEEGPVGRRLDVVKLFAGYEEDDSEVEQDKAARITTVTGDEGTPEEQDYYYSDPHDW